MGAHLDLDDVAAGHPVAMAELDALRAQLTEAREAMDRLAAHDIAADKREGLEHCVELQHVLDVLARLRKVATSPQRP